MFPMTKCQYHYSISSISLSQMCSSQWPLIGHAHWWQTVREWYLIFKPAFSINKPNCFNHLYTFWQWAWISEHLFTSSPIQEKHISISFNAVCLHLAPCQQKVTKQHKTLISQTNEHVLKSHLNKTWLSNAVRMAICSKLQTSNINWPCR